MSVQHTGWGEVVTGVQRHRDASSLHPSGSYAHWNDNNYKERNVYSLSRAKVLLEDSIEPGSAQNEGFRWKGAEGARGIGA